MSACAWPLQVGYDRHSYGYRDLEGCKVHQALREPYGEPYSEVRLLSITAVPHLRRFLWC